MTRATDSGSVPCRTRFVAAALAMMTLAAACTRGADRDQTAHEDAATHDEEDAHEEGGFGPEALAAFGVTVATAGAGVVDLGVDLPGEIRPDANRVAHLAARFPGIVRSVQKEVGDRVRAGDVLATIESENLAVYPLKAGMDGVVLDRHVTVGEGVGREDAAFVVADLREVWVHVSVYQEDVARVAVGQPVRVTAGHGIADAESVVAYVAPVVDQASRTASARAILPNGDGRWRPGLFVTVRVLDPAAAPIVIPRTALQVLEGRPVVFVVDGERFVPRVVATGRTGDRMVEITAGLAPGERFAATETFLVKAELGKGAAEHEH